MEDGTSKPGAAEPMLVLAAGSLVLFLALLADWLAGGFLATQVDPWVRDRVGTDTGPWHDAAAALTVLGDWWVLVPLVLVSMVLLGRRGAPHHGLLLGAWAFGHILLTHGVKWLVSRPRPEAPDLLTAFPSGHAANSLVVWGLLLMVALHRPGVPRRGAVPTAIVAGVAGLSRLVLDVHWFTDVLAGWCFGLAFLASYLYVEPRVAPAPRARAG